MSANFISFKILNYTLLKPPRWNVFGFIHDGENLLKRRKFPTKRSNIFGKSKWINSLLQHNGTQFHSINFQLLNSSSMLSSTWTIRTRTALNVSIGLYLLINVWNHHQMDPFFLFLWNKKTPSSSETTNPSQQHSPPNSNGNHHHQDANSQSSSMMNTSSNNNNKPPKMKIIKVKPDGNCLFRVISMGLYHTEDYHLQLRLAAVEWMRSHLDTEIDKGLRLRHALILDGPGDNNNNSDIERYYLRNMQCSGVWGDFNCIVALANCLQQPRVQFKIVILSRHNYGARRGNQKIESIVDVQPPSSRSTMNDVKDENVVTVWLAFNQLNNHYDWIQIGTE
ncbi:hypothetical protein FDP41_006639 [Naegleria fowleri]|uniref:OTU domain-containing protein n=1 Tax=Naegleria fowleri TaxID=5763 RepID=A0A6A5BBY6_NAEFO|nr:uncharacterized protein FDP41_006639 [Naegleria fowleri]KAF0974607.1 hypothetical protein FDP41_006639 [Naegleria fowleri]